MKDRFVPIDELDPERRKELVAQLLKGPLPQIDEVRFVTSPLAQERNPDRNLGCFPGCYYYGDSCYRKDCDGRNKVKPSGT